MVSDRRRAWSLDLEVWRLREPQYGSGLSSFELLSKTLSSAGRPLRKAIYLKASGELLRLTRRLDIGGMR